MLIISSFRDQQAQATFEFNLVKWKQKQQKLQKLKVNKYTDIIRPLERERDRGAGIRAGIV